MIRHFYIKERCTIVHRGTGAHREWKSKPGIADNYPQGTAVIIPSLHGSLTLPIVSNTFENRAAMNSDLFQEYVAENVLGI